MIAVLQAKWEKERDLMSKAADKLGKMLACSSQEEAAQLWEKYEKEEVNVNATARLRSVADDQSASSFAYSATDTTIRKTPHGKPTMSNWS
jgi:hypothetical protein